MVIFEKDVRPLFCEAAATDGFLDLEYSALAWSIKCFLCSYSFWAAAARCEAVMDR